MFKPQIEGWPQGTKLVGHNGKQGVILPEPTDMRKFSHDEIIRKKAYAEIKPEDKSFNGRSAKGSSGSQEKEPMGAGLGDDPRPAQKYYHTRQEKLVTEKRQARKFKRENPGEVLNDF